MGLTLDEQVRAASSYVSISTWTWTCSESKRVCCAGHRDSSSLMCRETIAAIADLWTMASDGILVPIHSYAFRPAYRPVHECLSCSSLYPVALPYKMACHFIGQIAIMNTTLSICAAKIQSSHWFPHTTRNAVRPVSQLANYSVLSDIHFPPCHSECAQSALISPKRWGQSRQKLFGLKKDEAFQVWYVRIEHIAQLLEVSIPMWYRGVEFFLFGPRPNLASVETVWRSTLIDMQVFCIGFDFSQRGINFKVGSGQSLRTL